MMAASADFFRLKFRNDGSRAYSVENMARAICSGVASDYIMCELYGPNAGQSGGVFEENEIVGAIGAKR
ncbi:MAG: hypothetical protein OXH79_02005 [Boseongicola sp.]|nr:hypothetical protein [Boseongicola sp.]